MATLFKTIEKKIAPVKRRVMNMLARGVINLITDSGGVQVVQFSGMAEETHNKVERFQNYGFTACPPEGSECIILFMGGNRDHPVVVSAEHRNSRKSAVAGSQSSAGDSLLYTSNANFIRLQSEDGKIYLDAPDNLFIRSSKTLRLEAEDIEIHANTKIKWDCAGRGFDYLPTKTDSWETGSVAGSTSPITAPEHPPAPSETPL